MRRDQGQPNKHRWKISVKLRGRGGWGESISTRWTVDMQMPHCPTLEKWRWGSYNWWGWFVCAREMGEGVLDGSRWAQSQECHRLKPNKSTASPQENSRSYNGRRHCRPALLLCAVAPLRFGLFVPDVDTLGSFPNLCCTMQRTNTTVSIRTHLSAPNVKSREGQKLLGERWQRPSALQRGLSK